MATVEELMEQKRFLEQRILGLQKYECEIRRIRGEISGVTYRLNSEYGGMAGDIRQREILKKELREKTAGLKEEYQVSPYGIPVQIREFELGISRIKREMKELENGSMVQSEQLQRQPETEKFFDGIAGGSRQSAVLAERQARHGESDTPAHRSRSPPPEERQKSGFDERRRVMTAQFSKRQQERTRGRGSRSR